MQPGFAQLGFHTIQCPSVFRSEPLPERPVSVATPPLPSTAPSRTSSVPSGMSVVTQAVQQAPAKAPSLPKPASPAPSVDSTQSSWAAVGRAPGQKSIVIAPEKPANRRFMLLNQHEERLDIPIPKADPSAQQRLFDRTAKRKVCNNFHLRGKCEAGEYCDYSHAPKLTPGEQLALKHRARTRSCPQRSYCRDVDCTNGHVCPYGDGCFHDGCWFQDVHDVEKVSGNAKHAKWRHFVDKRCRSQQSKCLRMEKWCT